MYAVITYIVGGDDPGPYEVVMFKDLGAANKFAERQRVYLKKDVVWSSSDGPEIKVEVCYIRKHKQISSKFFK